MDKDVQLNLLNSIVLSKEPKEFLERAQQFNEYMMMYNCAIQEVKTKFEILNNELALKNGHSPIEFIQSRVKKPESIVEKLNRKNIPVSMESLNEIKDIAGIRVICSFIDDIYKISNYFLNQDDITLIKQKDYIKTPKENGYRSLHLIIEVPVFFSDDTKLIPVEIQIRTIAMDFWASLEHQLKYKKDIPNEKDIINELRSCAFTIAETDKRMQEIKNQIDTL